MHLPYQPLSPLTLFDYQGGYTAIILASARGHQYCVELLVLSGANVNAQNTVRRTRLLPIPRGGADPNPGQHLYAQHPALTYSPARPLARLGI